jgi:hypothetical protein
VGDVFAPDTVIVFRGGPDRTFGQASAQFTETEDELVAGELAVVRLNWTGTIKGVGAPR